MVLRKLMGFCAFAIFVGAASFATAGIPDLDDSTTTLAYGGTGTLVLFSLPNGSGDAFNAALDGLGGTADATVTVTLVDGLGNLISDFAWEDLWLESSPATIIPAGDPGHMVGLTPCPGQGAVADRNTDEFGQTTWTFPLFAGGASDGLTFVAVNGDRLTNGVALSHVSVDANSDGVTDVLDVVAFAADLFSGSYQFRTDFNYDSVNDVLDVIILAGSKGLSCP